MPETDNHSTGAAKPVPGGKNVLRRVRGRHRLGDAQPAGEAQRDQPRARVRDAGGPRRARGRRARRRRRAHRRRRGVSAGMDLQRVLPRDRRRRKARRLPRSSALWQWRLLCHYPKPTIAMVNGWCFGGAFTPLVSCDLAIAAEDAAFRALGDQLGDHPGRQWSRAVAVMNQRDALYYIMTGETFDGRGGRDGAGQRGGAAGAAAGARARWQAAAREEPGRAARREARVQARARHVLGCRGLSLGEERSVSLLDPRRGARRGCGSSSTRRPSPGARHLQARRLMRRLACGVGT